MVFISWHFCINIYDKPRYQHNFTFELKMKSDKEHICHCFCFVFIKKITADAHRIICEMYDENVIIFRTCADLNNLKMISISDKKHSIPYNWKRTNCKYCLMKTLLN